MRSVAAALPLVLAVWLLLTAGAEADANDPAAALAAAPATLPVERVRVQGLQRTVRFRAPARLATPPDAGDRAPWQRW